MKNGIRVAPIEKALTILAVTKMHGGVCTAGTELRDIGCTDLRLRALGRKLLVYSQTATLTPLDFARHLKQATSLVVGLSRLHYGKHWPILVGVHTLPALEVEVDYAHL